jgi:hypothetical protein
LERDAAKFSVVLTPFRRVSLRFYKKASPKQLSKLMALENKFIAISPYKPAKDPKGGGMPQGSPQDLKSLLKHLQLGQGLGR